ncbi:hypothetical protein E6H29_02630 [Candidatus Bathyarchaeota archaeon]|nr:MAG: hypothetical protein E6H29_02630 [Candidatus Bathyarchaeota archaeon]
MTLISQTPEDSLVRTFEFDKLDRSLSPIENLVNNFGIVYVTSITRDGCSGCAEQKPLFRDLANKIAGRHQQRAVFSSVHIRYNPEDDGESRAAKRAFRHPAYPTYMIHVKSKLGSLELYRAVYPTMEELEQQIMSAFELADYYKVDSDAT